MRLKTTEENRHIISEIRHEYSGRAIELDYNTPFQLLCAVILSAQSTDRQVNRITPALFRRVREPADMLGIDLSEVTWLVRSINYFNSKARYIHESGRILTEEYDGRIPNDLSELRRLPGVGIKTAKVVLAVLYDLPYVGVDTHIHRVCNRIWIVRTKTPEQTDAAIAKRLNDADKRDMHHPFVLFGRYRCTARNPKCSDCPVQKWCNYFAQMRQKKDVEEILQS